MGAFAIGDEAEGDRRDVADDDRDEYRDRGEKLAEYD
jgi:hypothetical protein